jgi:MFS family permease
LSNYPHAVSGFFSDTFRSLRHRNYRLFFWGQLVSLIGTWLQNTALGIISFVGSAPIFFLSLYAGTFIDEFPKRRLLVITQAAAGLLAFVLAAAIWADFATVFVIGAIAFMLGVVNAFDLPTRQAFVVEMSGKEDLTNAVALNSAVFNGARLIGPALAAEIIVFTSIPVCFFLNGVSYIAVIAGLMMMKFSVEQRRPRARKISRMKSMAEGVQFLSISPQLRSLMILVIAMTIFGWSYSVNLPVVAGAMLRGDASTYGLLLSANGLGALLAALSQAAFAGKLVARKMVFIGIGVFVASLCSIALIHVFWVILLSLVGTGWGIITFFITANTTLQRQVPDELRGRVMGIYSLSFAGLFPFGSLLAGFLAHRFGLSIAFGINASVLTLIAIPVYFFVRKLPLLSGVATMKEVVQGEVATIEDEQIARG